MNGGGGSNTTTTTQNSAPWGPAQPYLEQIMSGAQSAYNSGGGFAPYPGSTVAPFSSQTQQALQGIQNTASAGNPLGSASQNAALGLLNGGGLTSQSQQAANYLQPYANGSYVNGGSPEFNAALNYQAGQLTDDINRAYGNAGRSGSAANTGAIADQVGNFRNNAMANELAREQGLQMQGISGLGTLGQQGASNLGTFSALAPGIYSQQYAPYQQLAGAGNAYDTQAQNVLTGQVNQFNQQQLQPWNLLNAYTGVLSGSGSQGGTSTSTQTQPKPSPLQGLLGGGLLGSQVGSAFGPVGTVIGGLGGGILGLL